ncbi:hypothetical protein BCR23_02615 [Enterococcus quebecensis]|uniref:Uncharacterized protein n=1 Tax=Enterococcus quebecensis TaxID=903983 RepID=A0A1E5H3X0_9ENTE|nr:hypothetical protein BCR23_02615 [Enterococcus quebecensis]
MVVFWYTEECKNKKMTYTIGDLLKQVVLFNQDFAGLGGSHTKKCQIFIFIVRRNNIQSAHFWLSEPLLLFFVNYFYPMAISIPKETTVRNIKSQIY